MNAASRPPVSAVVITRNASRHLGAVLAAASGCDERLVLDSGSTDDTLAIAAAAGARIERQPFLGYGPQKRRAVELAAHDWILSLDADEVLDEEARAGLAAADLSDPAACYAIRRRTFVGRRELRHGPWAEDRPVRVFNRTTANFKPLAVHEEVVAAGRPRSLPGSLLHYSFIDCADVIARSLAYVPSRPASCGGRGSGCTPSCCPCAAWPPLPAPISSGAAGGTARPDSSWPWRG